MRFNDWRVPPIRERTGLVAPMYVAARAIECGEELLADYKFDRADSDACPSAPF